MLLAVSQLPIAFLVPPQPPQKGAAFFFIRSALPGYSQAASRETVASYRRELSATAPDQNGFKRSIVSASQQRRATKAAHERGSSQSYGKRCCSGDLHLPSLSWLQRAASGDGR